MYNPTRGRYSNLIELNNRLCHNSSDKDDNSRCRGSRHHGMR